MKQRCRFVVLVVGLSLLASTAEAQRLRIRDICRLKGQEVNNLHGMGLVVGLKGTGDGEAAPTSRALSKFMQLMGGQIAADTQGRLNIEDVSDAKNVAMVVVNAQIPPIGAQQGDLLDLTISAISAKSLEGGYLLVTPLIGPRPDDPTVYAIAGGPLNVRADGPPTRATVSRGGKMETTIRAPFQQDGKVTLIIDQDFANFDTSQRLEEAIKTLPDFTISSSPGNRNSQSNVRAIDQLHVEVRIPDLYRDSPIEFISAMMSAPITLQANSNRVVVNEKEGIVLIGEDVTFAPGLVLHKNMRIEGIVGPPIRALDASGPPNNNPKLKSLADALNTLNVPAADLIEIIKTLKGKGDLYGEVKFQ